MFGSAHRKAQVARELHSGDVAEAKGGGGGHSEQHFNQVQSRGALPGITTGLACSRKPPVFRKPSVWCYVFFLPLRRWRTCAPMKYLTSFTSSCEPCVKTTSRHRSISSENILLFFEGVGITGDPTIYYRNPQWPTSSDSERLALSVRTMWVPSWCEASNRRRAGHLCQLTAAATLHTAHNLNYMSHSAYLIKSDLEITVSSHKWPVSRSVL